VKAFGDRSPRKVGAIALIIMALIVGSVIVFNRGLFSSTYPVEARFSNAAGIAKGTQVLLAGVPVGSVGKVQLAGNSVIATLNLNQGTVLPHDTAAAVQVQTLLGLEDVSLDPLGGWSHPLQAGALINNTQVPVQIYQLQNDAGHLLTGTNAKALNSLVEELGTITQGKRTQVKEIIDGLGALTTTVNQRSGEVSQLIDSAQQVSSTLASHDQALVSLIDNLNTVVAGLAAHSGQLGSLIDNIEQMAAQTSALVGGNEPQLNSLLQNLHSVLGIVSQHQLDLAEGLSYLASGVKGFASVGYSGPSDYPNTWANIYTNPVTLLGAFGVLGPCGALDQALDLALGPDPLPCSDQTGPLPGGGTSTGGATSTGGSGSSASTSSPASSALGGSNATDAPSSGVGGLEQLFVPLIGANP
jgi:phospholipid/cholesterol/gamma-HCH transport system substrate-binding protein